ncbi:MAG: hypothetical protein SVG88_09940 [Halobacteriales archaeon]|nr:hypothetical protein [Halobacteriales archaeon]
MAADADADRVECWLVERDYDDKGLVKLVYATPDGERHIVRERSSRMLRDGVTAAESVPADRLEPVTDSERQARYATEVERMQARHDPDETV